MKEIVIKTVVVSDESQSVIFSKKGTAFIESVIVSGNGFNSIGIALNGYNGVLGEIFFTENDAIKLANALLSLVNQSKGDNHLSKNRKKAIENNKTDLTINAIINDIRLYEAALKGETAKLFSLERAVCALKAIENPNDVQAQLLETTAALCEQCRETAHFINGFIMKLWRLLQLLDNEKYNLLFDSYRREV